MFRWKVGRLMGIDLYINWTFLLAPVLIMLATWERGAPPAAQGPAFFGLALTLATFVCVILHEFGHARMARVFGIRTRDITISLIGGVARLERMSEKPWEEFLIAIAGPAVNIGIAFCLLLVGLPFGGSARFIEIVHTDFLACMFWMNVGLVLFNMLPAFPMDGGRVLRAILSLLTDHLRATEIAAYIGMAIAAVFGVIGILNFTSWPVLVVIAFFIFTAAQQELAMTRRRWAMLAEQPVDVIPVDEPADGFPRVHVVEPGFSGLAWDVTRRAWVIWHNGRPVSSYGAKPE
jgi:Zn-dependent protease